MSDGRKEIRKIMDMLGEEMPKVKSNNPKMLNENGYLDADDMNTGNETRVEVEFKDGDQIEVEVYAQGVDQLKRLMDLAGIFHQDKQQGNVGDALPGEPMIDPGLDGVPDVPGDMPGGDALPGDMPGDMPVDPMGGEPEVMGSPELPGTDVPVSADSTDMDAETPELDFDMDMESEEYDDESLGETRGARWDYGHPNPNLGQEPYEPEASNYSGLAGKPNRYVQAKHGDNPMVDASKPKKGETAIDGLDEAETSTKSLGDYLEEVNLEKKDLDEVNPDKVGELVAKTTPVNLSGPKLQAISNSADDLERDVASGQRQVDDLNPDQVMDLVTGDNAVKATGFSDPDGRKIKDLVGKFGDDFEEGQRHYSFKQQNLPFQGLTGVQRVRRNALRAARRSLKK